MGVLVATAVEVEMTTVPALVEMEMLDMAATVEMAVTVA